MAKKQTATAKTPKKETAEANDARKSVKKPSGKMKVKFLKSPLHVYRLAYGVGEEATLDAKEAQELIDTGHAEKV